METVRHGLFEAEVKPQPLTRKQKRLYVRCMTRKERPLTRGEVSKAIRSLWRVQTYRQLKMMSFGFMYGRGSVVERVLDETMLHLDYAALELRAASNVSVFRNFTTGRMSCRTRPLPFRWESHVTEPNKSAMSIGGRGESRRAKRRKRHA